MQLLRHIIQRWIWRDGRRRAQKLLSFAETEADGGRDLARAAERTGDPVLRRLYLVHAGDEQRHAVLFRHRGAELLATLPADAPATGVFLANAVTPGERGLDDLRVDEEPDDALLAFLHLSEKSAAVRFAQYRDAVRGDAATTDLFGEILRDETFHMKYTRAQLTRIAPRSHRLVLWRTRLHRLWKGYLRLAVAVAGVMGTVILTLEYFLFLGPFALLAQRRARREPEGWVVIAPGNNSLKREY